MEGEREGGKCMRAILCFLQLACKIESDLLNQNDNIIILCFIVTSFKFFLPL